MNVEKTSPLDSISEYGEEFILQIIGQLLTDRQFLERIILDVNPLDFDNESERWVIKNIFKYYNSYRTIPTTFYLRTQLLEYVKNASNPEAGRTFKNFTGQLIADAYASVKADVEPAFQDMFFDFCRVKALQRATMKCYELAMVKDYDSIPKIMHDALLVGKTQHVGHSYENDIDIRFNDELEPAIPYPFEHWNEFTEGGMHVGDLCMILAPKGAGKSWMAVACAAHAKQLGYNVQYYTLELDDKIVAKRVDCHYLGVPMKQLANYYSNLKLIIGEKEGQLTVTRLKGKQKTLAYIKQHVKMLTNEGKKPDLVVIDYIDILRNENSDPQAGTKELYEDIRDWASEEGFPVLSPAQINRTGIKTAIIEGDMVAGFIEKLQIADQVITIGRPKEHKKTKTCVIFWDKNRYGDDGFAEIFGFDAGWGEFTPGWEWDEAAEKAKNDEALEAYTNGNTKYKYDFHAKNKARKAVELHNQKARETKPDTRSLLEDTNELLY